MNLFLCQLKSLIFKNYKVKKAGHLKLSIAFQLVVHLFIIILFNISNLITYKAPSTPITRNDETTPINSFFLTLPGQFPGEFAAQGTISFMVPLDVKNRDVFVNNLVRNKAFVMNPSLQSKVFDDINLFNNFNKDSLDDLELVGAVVFNKDYTDYTIRLPYEMVTNPDSTPIEYDYQWRYKTPESEKYTLLFGPIQALVNQAIIQTETNEEIEIDFKIGKLSKSENDFTVVSQESDTSMAQYKIATYPFLFIIQSVLILFGIIAEKEKGQEQGLIAVGVHPTNIWLSWEMFFLPFNLVVSVSTALMEINKMFKSINFFIGVLLFVIYGFSIYGFTIMMTKIVKRKKSAFFVMTLIYIAYAFTLDNVLELDEDHPTLTKVIYFFFSPYNLSLILSKFYKQQKFLENGIPYENQFYTHFLILIGSTLFYHLVTFVIEFFSFKFSNLFRIKGDFTERLIHQEDIEEDPKNCGEPMIQVKGIFKTYKIRRSHLLGNLFPGKKVNVLKGINFNIYNNEIFAILGHNGAGKSTLIKIMTSLLHADHGKIYYEGLELVSNVNKIRKNIGLCLQDSIVFDKLTVEDNLKVFAGLKGTSLDIDSILKDIGMTNKKDSKMDELSGGQRRKVCIGLALVGNPKFIFLDEPTTSLDPFSRRKIWDILMKIKKDRVIILCTHYMDEADILADRKVIINRGEVRCLGSSVYLKNHFNMKYLLNIETKMKYREDLDTIILKHIPDAKFNSNHLDQVNEASSQNHSLSFDDTNATDDDIHCYTWTLPMSSTNTYSNLFNELELLKGGMVHRVSLDSPYLEDLFIRLTTESFEKDRMSNDHDVEPAQLTNGNDEKLPKLDKTKVSFLCKTFRLLKYRFTVVLRDRIFLFIYFVVPFVLIGFFMNSLKDTFAQDKMLEFNDRIVTSPTPYYGNQINYDQANSNVNQTLTSEVIELSNDMVEVESTSYDFFDKDEDVDVGPPPAKNEKSGEIQSIESVLMKHMVNGNNKIGLTHYSKKEMNLIGIYRDYDESTPYYISSFNANLLNNTYEFTLYYNDSMAHSVPLTINTITNALLSLKGIDETVVTHSHPLSEKDNKSYFEGEGLMFELFVLCIVFTISFFGPRIIKERNDKLLKLLNLSGITNKSYLMASLIVNCILLYVLCLLIIIICAVVGVEALRRWISFVLLAIVLIPCCVSIVLHQYVVSFVFKDFTSYLFNVCFTFAPVFIWVRNIVQFDFDYEYSYRNEYAASRLNLYWLMISTLVPVLHFPMSLLTIFKFYMFRESKEEEIDFTYLYKFTDGFGRGFTGNLLCIVIYATAAVVTFNQVKIMNTKIAERSKKETENHILRLKELDEDLYKEYERVANASQTTSPPLIRIEKGGEEEKDIIHYNSKEDRKNTMVVSDDQTKQSSTLISDDQTKQSSSLVSDDQTKQSSSLVSDDQTKHSSTEIPIRVVNVGKEYTLTHVSDPEKLLKNVDSSDPTYGVYHYSHYNWGLVNTSLRNVSLGINSRECFGLIGPNGSGKTTLLNIITYNHAQTVGKVYYDGVENVNIKEDHFMMGYCPQNDILWENLTLYEHLLMLIHLRGYSRKTSQKYAKMYMEFCKIEEHKNKYPHELSGGTRRKLCLLIALIGFSNKIMLDEPSSGMDPATRRYIWNVLTNYKRNEDSLILLTTHSMEEAEILCDRIGMLVNGELMALGTPNQLKMKFGNKYMLEIQCTDGHLVDEWIKQDIPMMRNEEEVICEFKSEKRLKYNFKFTDNHGDIFRVMESYKEKGVVLDYSFCQTNLEDVFLKFARRQENQEM